MSPKLASTLAIVALCVFASLTAKTQIQARFSASPVSGCAPLVVHFNDESTGGVTQWKWDLGNATISYLQHPVATYFNAGTYTVKLLVQNAAGKDSITKLQYITVHAAPAPAFSAAIRTGCAPLQVAFMNNSSAGSGSIANLTWDFGDGNFSSAGNPTHTYASPGNYHVSLRVVNSTGCSKTITEQNYIQVAPAVQAVFTHSAPAGCTAPETIRFQNQSTGSGTLSYQWLFGDGGSSTEHHPSHTYTTAGIYNVQLIATSAAGCRDTFVVQQLNIGSLRADFTVPATLCAGASIPFTNTSSSTPDSVRWNFGDGSFSTALHPNKSFTAAGTYRVTLTIYSGSCQDVVSKDVVVAEPPVANFSGSPLTACAAPLTVHFTSNTAGAVSNAWTFGDGGTASIAAPSYTYNNMGSYDVRLISTNAAGCSDTLTRLQYVQLVKPQVSINNLPQEGCAPLAFNFRATINSVDPVVSYLWDFGDGSTSTAATPSHVFAEGLYTIQLITTTASGCRDTVRRPTGIRASSKPQAAFTATPREVCAYKPVQFTDESTGTVTGWLWLFGDGGTSTQQHPTHEYEDTGRFTVTLVVANYGCYDTLVMPNYIYVNPPIARFEPIVNCELPFVRSFTDQSPGADEWYWNFGDGQTSTAQHPVHTYSAVGRYEVTLRVKNNRTGCEHTKMHAVIIADEQARFAADVTTICRRNAVQFTAMQNYLNGIAQYAWDFGDGSEGIGNTVSHVYTQAGTYNVRLIITDAAGCMDTLVKPAYIRVNGPTAGFAPALPGICLAASVSFNDQSTTDGVHPINTWTWNYGDGVTEVLNAAPFAHTYNSPGSYHVTLTVTDAAGCVDSILKNNTIVVSRPLAVFATTDTLSCPGKTVRFTNSSTGPELRYAWNFGDGNSSTLATPNHVYTRDGVYTIRLRITDQYGCTDESIRSQYVRIVTPIAAFTMSDSVSTCPPLVVQFTNQSVNQNTYHWDFGDGNESNESSPSHFYNMAGVYFPKLTITSAGGCTSVVSKRVVVQGPSGSFSYQNFRGCKPLTVRFAATTKSRTSFVWDFNDGTTILTTDSIVSHTYTVPGIYVPRMIIKDASGCTVPIMGRDTIVVSGVAAAFTTNEPALCSSGNVQFTNNSVSNDVVTGYAWDFGDGGRSTLASPSHFYNAEGTYTVKLKVFTAMGCIDSTSSVAAVRVVRTPSISISQTPDGCVPLLKTLSGTLLNADTSAISWNWQISNGTTSISQVLRDERFVVAGQFYATLTARNSSGCSDTATAVINAYALPMVNAGSDITICKGTPQLLHATGAVSYSWSPAASLSCTNCPSPAANPSHQTNYIVTGTSAQGCVNRDTVQVAVQAPFKMLYSRGDTLCLGETATLSASGAASYAWGPSAGLSQITGATVKASPNVTTQYRVVGSDAVGCFKDTAFFNIKVYPIPTVEAGADVTINVGQVITLTPTISADVTEVYWTPTGAIFRSQFPSIDLKPKQTTVYQVEALNPGGCRATDQLTVQVLCNGANVFIPNTFSPNGDGANEQFFPRGTGLFAIRTARIFNRWGEQVFESHNMKPNDAMGGWNGTYKGRALSSDVFVYVFEIVCDNNEILVYKGDVALIR